MRQFLLMLRKICLSFLTLSIFNLMAVGLDLYIPLSLINIIIVAIFDISGFVMMIIFYMFIL